MPSLEDAGKPGEPKNKSKVKLVKVAEEGGRRLAKLDVSIDLRRKHGKLSASFWKLSGEASFDIAGGFMVSLDLKGKFQCSHGRIRVTHGGKGTYRNLHEETHKGGERLQLAAEMVAEGSGDAAPAKPDDKKPDDKKGEEGKKDDEPGAGGNKSP